MPSQVVQTTKLGADVSTEDEAAYPPVFGPAEPMADDGFLSTSPRDGRSGRGQRQLRHTLPQELHQVNAEES
jgi:hypothetical protein